MGDEQTRNGRKTGFNGKGWDLSFMFDLKFCFRLFCFVFWVSRVTRKTDGRNEESQEEIVRPVQTTQFYRRKLRRLGISPPEYIMYF